MIGPNRGLNSGVIVQSNSHPKPMFLETQVETHGTGEQRDYCQFGHFWYIQERLSLSPSDLVISVGEMSKTLDSFWIVLGRKVVNLCSAL